MNMADTWLGNTAPNPQAGNVEVRAMDTARLIAERPSTVVITRDLGSGQVITLDPQTVRIEVVQNIRGTSEQRDAMVATTKQYVVIIGLRNHPTLPNTDVQRGDTFLYQGRQYEVVEYIDTVPGRLLMSCELTP